MLKKISKKTIIIILVISTIMLSFPIPLVYAYPDPWDMLDLDDLDDVAIDDPADMDEILNSFVIDANKYFSSTTTEIGNIAKTLDQGLAEVSEVAKNTAKTNEELAKLAQSMKEGTFANVFKYASMSVAMFNNVLNILKTFGVIKDSNQQALDSILDAIKSLQRDVTVLNQKVSMIQEKLRNDIADIKYRTDIINAAQNQQNWSNFLTNYYEPLNDFSSDYSSLFNATASKWANSWKETNKTDLRALYNDKGMLLYSSENYNGYNNLLNTPGYSDDYDDKKYSTSVEHEIILPSKYLSISSKVKITADNYETEINKAVKTGVAQAIKDGVIKADKDSLSFWNFGKATEEDIINKITKDLVDSIYYEINDTISHSEYSNGITYSNKALTLLKKYSNELSGINKLSSPFDDVLNSLEHTFAFEGEARKFADSYKLLLGMSTIQFGTLTSTLVMSNSDIPDADKNQVAVLTKNTLKTINTIYGNHITGKDNYCYPVSGLLTYVDVSAQSFIETFNNYESDEKAKFFNRTTDWVIVDASNKYNRDNDVIYRYETKKNASNLKSAMLDADKITYLYHFISSSNTDKTVMDYLKEYKVITDDKEHSSILATPDYKVENQAIDSTKYKTLVFGSNFKYYRGSNDNRIKDGYETGKVVAPIKPDDYTQFTSPLHTKLVGTIVSIDGHLTGATVDDISKKITTDQTMAVSILVYKDSDKYSKAQPRYLFTKDGIFSKDLNIEYTIEESAFDPYKESYDEPFRTVYHVLMENKLGALVVNYNNDNKAESIDVNNLDSSKYLKINNASDFKYFLGNIANGESYSGVNIILGNDIDLGGTNLESYWSSGNAGKEFKGHFNGNGKTLSNVTINSSGDRVALFRTTGTGAVIENLKLENVNIIGSGEKSGTSALIGYAADSLVLDNIQILSGKIEGYNYVGGLVGQAKSSAKIQVINSENNASVTARKNDAGGILGNVGNYYVKNTINNGDVSSSNGNAGGIVGYNTSDNKNVSSFVRSCKNTGNITGFANAGGISGFISSNDAHSRFYGNQNTGTIISLNKSAGGIVGYTEGGGVYASNKNTGQVESKNRYAGGILGENQNDPIVLRNNTNKGKVLGSNKTGGIAGYLGNKDSDLRTIITNNTNTGIIEATSKDNGDAGGIIGAIVTDSHYHEVNENTNTGSVKAQRQAGGIVGYMTGGGQFKSNTNKANITSYTQNAGGIVGRIEDDECTFRGSSLGKTIIGSGNTRISPDEYDYIIKAETDGMHAAKICGWDGYNKKSINTDSLLGTIFGEGNLPIVLTMTGLVIVASIAAIVIKKRNNKKESTMKTSKPKQNTSSKKEK